MARSRRKAHGTKRGRFKRKRMGKGWLTVRRQPSASRPVLRITEPDESAGESKATEQQD